MREEQSNRKRTRTWLVPTIVLVAVIALAAVASSGGNSGKPATTPTASDSATAAQSEQYLDLARRQAGDPLAIGNIDAPVVLVQFAEFQCPFCGKFARDTEPILVEKYVRNGTLRIEWRDFPYLGSESTIAALAGRAAANQGKFWQFHDALFANQFPPNSGNLTEPYLIGVAKTLSLNTKEFQSDMRSSATKAAVEKDFIEGQSIGVTGTPSFLINFTPVVGAQPLSIFEQAIEAAAAQVAARTK